MDESISKYALLWISRDSIAIERINFNGEEAHHLILSLG